MHKPRFKSENRYDSFCYEQPEGFGFEWKKLHLSKIGDITYRNEHHPAGVMRTCTVKRDARGDWNAAINILYRGLNTQTLRSAVNGQPV